MIRMLRFAAVALAFTASSLSAQEAASAPGDTATEDPHAVTAYSIRSGKLMVSSKANPKPTALPDGTYMNEAGVILVFVNGRVTRVQETTDRITEIASMRLNRQRLVILTQSTNALMAVIEVMLPSGTFRAENGNSSVTIVYGRPAAFTITGGT